VVHFSFFIVCLSLLLSQLYFLFFFFRSFFLTLKKKAHARQKQNKSEYIFNKNNSNFRDVRCRFTEHRWSPHIPIKKKMNKILVFLLCSASIHQQCICSFGEKALLYNIYIGNLYVRKRREGRGKSFIQGCRAICFFLICLDPHLHKKKRSMNRWNESFASNMLYKMRVLR